MILKSKFSSKFIKKFSPKVNKKKVKKLMVIIVISIIMVFSILKNKGKNFSIQEDLIFFKLFNSKFFQSNKKTKSINDTNEYKIIIQKGKTYSEKINLFQTIDIYTYVNKKVAPGTKGSFNILLSSNYCLEYKLQIIDKSPKPENLKFLIKYPNGNIKKGEFKVIPVEWEWKYEINQNADKQDTIDSENIRNYEFEICSIGNSV